MAKFDGAFADEAGTRSPGHGMPQSPVSTSIACQAPEPSPWLLYFCFDGPALETTTLPEKLLCPLLLRACPRPHQKP